MNRAVVEALLPCLAALVLAFVGLRAIVRLSGGRLNHGRLRRVHRCQEGGVQSLAFVVTLPVFLMIVQFIVQVSQLMIATMVVHYAAFASARSASVWSAAEVDGLQENKLRDVITEGTPVLLTGGDSLHFENAKYRQVFKAAALACAPIAPSRDLGLTPGPIAADPAAAMKRLYPALDPSSKSNARMPRRIDNKLAYSFENTLVLLEFVDKNSRQGPTYNPRVPVKQELPDGNVEWVRDYDPHEVGWEDPLTVTVAHRLALLPGPGRFLARHLVRADGQPDRVSGRIDRTETNSGTQLYTTTITASATMTNEGFKSVMPYAQQTY